QRFFHLLLEADEALSTPARTVDPQLVLEMCVVRLATLPPLLPMADVLRRLEALGRAPDGGDGKPAGAARAPGAGGPAPAARPAPAAPRAQAAAADGGLWDRFLARVRQEKVSLYMALAAGRLVSADAGAFTIGIENEAMRRELTRKETLDRLRAIASD